MTCLKHIRSWNSSAQSSPSEPVSSLSKSHHLYNIHEEAPRLPPRNSTISFQPLLHLLEPLQPLSSTTKQEPFQNFLTAASLGTFPFSVSTCLFSAFWNSLHETATTSSAFSIPFTTSSFSRLFSIKIWLFSNFFKLTLLLPFFLPPSLLSLSLSTVYCLLLPFFLPPSLLSLSLSIVYCLSPSTKNVSSVRTGNLCLLLYPHSFHKYFVSYHYSQILQQIFNCLKYFFFLRLHTWTVCKLKHMNSSLPLYSISL